jgi:hypothetical protein
MKRGNPISSNYSMLSHPREPRVLALAGEAGWALPEHESAEAPAIRQSIRERYGLDVTLLGTVAGHYTDTEQEQAERVLALESHGADTPLPAGARWIGRSELDRLTLAVPEHRPALDQWLREMENGVVPAERAPWARLGWYATAALWVREQLERLGYREIGPVEQLHARVWSTVLRVPTVAGLVYFKAVAAPSYAFEPDVTQALADLFPANLPRVLAVDEARHWMLLADSGTSLRGALQASGDTAAYEAMPPHFARLQMATVPHVDRFLALGCPDRRLERLPEHFRALVADRPGLRVGQVGGLIEDDYARLQALAPEVEALCARLASYHLPTAAMHHEELSPGHVIPAGDDYIFFDWGDSCVSHPLSSLMMALRWPRLVLGWDEATLARVQHAYLAAWTAYEPMERLVEAYTLARRLALLCRALTWRAAVSQLEPGAKWEYADHASYWLGLFLRGED